MNYALQKDFQDVFKKLHRIRIRVKAISQEFLSGMYHSAFKGRGILFSEVREYVWGDEIRNIDWNVTARMNAPYVKLFEEERELSFILMADVSTSMTWGTKGMLKREMMTHIGGTLLYTALLNNDRTGALLFARSPIKYIPPRKGINHMMSILRDVYTTESHEPATSINNALAALFNALKKRSIILLISDFLDPTLLPHYTCPALPLVAKKHYLKVVFLYDPAEYEPPPGGLIPALDSESGEITWVDFHSRKNREKYREFMISHMEAIENMLKKNGIDYIKQSTTAPFLNNLMHLFAR